MKALGTTILFALCSVASAQAYSCNDVRALSAEQRAYYIKVFNITPAQQDRIRQNCYGSRVPRVHPVVDVSDEKLTATPRHGGRDAE
jgi:hypothetical protein